MIEPNLEGDFPSQPLDRLLPTCDPIEIGFVGRLMRSQNGAVAEARERVRPHHLRLERLALMYQAVLDLDAAGKPTDQLSVVHRLSEDGLLEKAGGAAFVSHVDDEAGPAGSLEHYARTIRERAANEAKDEILQEIETVRRAPDAEMPERQARIRTLTARLHFVASTIDMEEPSAAPSKALHAYPTTDAGNAEAIAARHGDSLRFDHRRERWLIFRRHRWHDGALEEIRQLAKLTARERFTDAGNVTDLKERERLARWAIGSESRSRLDSAIDLARSEAPIADTGEGWDMDPLLLGVENGVVDLRTGELRAGRRTDRITKAVSLEYDPKATAPRWERFLPEVFRSEADLIDFVHRAIGYSLTGLDREQVLFMLYGVGSNGKSVFLKTVRETLGPYGADTPFTTLEHSARASIPSDVAALDGRRFVTASETGSTARLNEARIKALTGGDEITARFNYGDWFTFRPTFKLWLSVNHRPRVADTSHAFWRRVRLIPFLETFTPETADQKLEEKLRAEARGILAWAVRGALEWQRRGLAPPESVTTATADYRQSEDQLAGFLTERCTTGPAKRAKAGQFFKAYTAWAEAEGLKERERLGSRTFGQEMASRFDRVKLNDGLWYLAVGLNAEWEADQ